MKRVGIIGGLSPESTIKYYEWLNEGVQKRLGGLHCAPLLLASVDFGIFVELKDKGDWETQGRLLAKEAADLQRAGADFIVLATNTMHMLTPQIKQAITIPFLHLADATADRILKSASRTIGLLGTKYTMEMDFYKDRLKEKGLKVLIPNDEDREIVNSIIYDKLCRGLIEEQDRAAYRRIIAKMVAEGADGVIMGCTEITTLIDQSDSTVPLFDTTRIHVEEALELIFA